MSAALPVTPEQIAEQAVGAAEAGAAILHLHARDPADGRPTPEPEVFRQFLPRIKDATDAVVNVTTGGGHNMSVAERTAAGRQLAPEMCSLNMGSMNFGLFPAAERFSDWKHAWEPKYLEDTRDFIFKNTFADIETILHDLGEANGTRFEFECYDVGHIHTLGHFLERGLVKPPLFVQFVLGVLGGIGPTADNLLHMKRTADAVLGDAYHFSVLAAGRHQLRLVTMGAALGGHVRVGLEDSLFIAKGEMAQSNAQQVAKIRRILEELSLEPATPTEAREMLQLKGVDQVAF
ncbi:3-keto-5-aminohexanoate cleavage protein [Rhodovibrio salinarum]